MHWLRLLRHVAGTLAALEGLAKQLKEAAAETVADKLKQTAQLLQHDEARIKRRKGYKHMS